ncbi:MAG TPA: PAS domain-containing protein [Bacteroidales bacterium]|nr:PAS domain-containing protein [Bacteroidales bacterium]
MIFSSKSILIFENQIDLKHLGSYLDKFDIKYSFAQDLKSFSDSCIALKYDAIVFSGVSEGEIDERVIEVLSESPNFRTPVLVIADDSKGLLKQVLSRQFDFMIFPFTPVEFTHRIEQMLRRSVSDNAIHQNLLGLRAIIENLPMGIIQTDTHGNIISLNREFTIIIGMAEKDISKENFFQLCHPDDYFIERKHLDRLLRKEEEKVHFEIRLINNEGTTSVCKILASAIWKDVNIFESYLFVVDKID